jgi:hypothetical protein
MNIILKEDIDYYRLTVAKVVFLTTVGKNYHLVKDFPKSSIMCIVHKDGQKLLDSIANDEQKSEIYISILQKPKKIPSEIKNAKIHIFYEIQAYKKNESKSNDCSFHLLDNEFSEKFSKEIENAFFNAGKYLECIPKEYLGMFEYYFNYAKNIINCNEKNLYKYYAKEKVDNNKHKVNDGYLYFSHPKHFNDPFDCNCTLSNNKNISDVFRVLCMTPMYDNILMWSYYADSHKGYCFEFEMNELIYKTIGLKVNGICIYGEVKYSVKRPPHKSPVNNFSYTNLNFYINSIFTKYKEWEHEREKRFIVISRNFTSEFIDLQSDIQKVYGGCNSTKSAINNTNKTINVHKLSKHNSLYKLI